MREIKFRAWYEPNKEMFSVDVLALSKCAFACPDHGRKGVSLAYQPSIKVMQFTGLKDKNGKEIYEGDIVGEKDVWWEPVVFDQGCFCVDLEPIGYHFEQEGTYLEVLGSIYENPELTGAR